MAKIIGNTTMTPVPKSDWNQTDETKADYIKNKPDFDGKIDADVKALADGQVATNKNDIASLFEQFQWGSF